MKTIRNWLDQLKEPERSEALSNMRPIGMKSSSDSLEDAVADAFHWRDTPQGDSYWNNIYQALYDGTYYDAPQHSPEEFEANAKAFMREATEEAHKPTEDILEEALRITGGDRMNDYGPPDQDFKRTAIIWEQLLNSRIIDGKLDIRPQDVASCMIAIKLSRQTHQNKRDNWVDLAGYARCGNLCMELEQNND